SAALTSSHSMLRRTSIEFLAREADCVHALLAACQSGQLDQIADVMAAVERFTWTIVRQPDAQFRFTVDEADYFISLLEHSDADLLASVAGILHAGFCDQPGDFNPFLEQSGPLDIKHRNHFARVLAGN